MSEVGRAQAPRSAARAWLPLALLGALPACVADNHPLGAGVVTFQYDQSAIYAADVLDDQGKPVLPRQAPYEKRVQLYMATGNEADRVSMTLHFLNAARLVAVVAVGDRSAGVVRRMADGGAGELPIGGVAPMNGELRWYLDYAACGPEGA